MDTITSLNENESLLDGQVRSRHVSSAHELFNGLGRSCEQKSIFLQEKILVDNLIKEGQAHIFKDWPPLGASHALTGTC